MTVKCLIEQDGFTITSMTADQIHVIKTALLNMTKTTKQIGSFRKRLVSQIDQVQDEYCRTQLNGNN